MNASAHLSMYESCKKIANCLQFAIKRNIMKKKEEAISMARTANIFARVEPEVKEQAEQVLDRLGIPMSNAVGSSRNVSETDCTPERNSF